MDKFLTVLAVFDDKTQCYLKNLQNSILINNITGTQTMDIPFHITLGSFSVEKCEELEQQIKTISTEFNAFSIDLKKISHFDNKVLFVQPEKNKILMNLQRQFCKNNIDEFSFYPHTTLLCSDKSQVKTAKQIAKKTFSPINTIITSLYLCEFFPTKIILKADLNI